MPVPKPRDPQPGIQDVFGFGEDLGSGTFMPGPENSHNGKTPNNPYAVTPESIASGMGGVAGQQTRLPLHKDVRQRTTSVTWDGGHYQENTHI